MSVHYSSVKPYEIANLSIGLMSDSCIAAHHGNWRAVITLATRHFQ